MADELRLHLRPEHRRILEALLREHLPGVEVWAYGSRVNGRSHDGSDLDLVLRGPGLEEIPAGQLADFEEAVRESTIPFLVEARDWTRLPERFHREIERAYDVLVESPAGSGRWGTVLLGDCIEMNKATYSPKENWSFVNYLDTSGITDNRVDTIQHLVSGDDNLPSRARRKVESGDIVFSTVRPIQRHFGLLREIPDNFLVSTGFAAFRGREGLAETGFVYRFLTQDRIVEQLQTIAEHSTSAYPSITPSDIERLAVALPPLPEQRAIAHIFGTLDDKIELNRRMNATLEAMARAIFKDWFVDFGPTRAKMEGWAPYLPSEIWEQFPDVLDGERKPVNWKFDTLARLAVTNSESWTERSHPPTVEYVDLSNAKWGKIDTTRWLDWSVAPSRARRIAKAGDTIVGITRPGNGSFAYISRDGLTVSTGFAVLSPHSAKYRDAVYFAATSSENINRLANLAGGHGGTYPAVKPNEVSETPITFSSDEVLSRFADLVSPIRAKIEHIKAESRTHAQTRDLLLPKLVSGEIRVRDAEETIEAVT